MTMDKSEVSIQVGSKYGCLTVLDAGEEYVTSDKYREYKEESDALEHEISEYERLDSNGLQAEKLAILQQQSMMDLSKHPSDVDEIFRSFVKYRLDFARPKLENLTAKVETHYKCQCKCGRICYYNAKTIARKPNYCFYPIPISTRHTYSVKAQNATWRKKQKYAGVECVVLRDEAECEPKTEYCERYNVHKLKNAEKRDAALIALRASYPHMISESYGVMPPAVHDTLEFVRRLDDTEKLYTKLIRKKETSGRYVKYAMYEYKCHLCGRTFQFSDADLQTKLQVHPATEYGCHAYNGYWSDGHCDCHQTSSFHWTVIDILEKHNVRYRTEVSFDGLVGDSGNPLRFDVCVWLNDVTYCLIECQGEQHFEPVAEFGGKNAFERQSAYDNMKREFCNRHGVRLIEIPRQKQNQYAYVETILRDMRIIS